nr:MAG TPA: hypothetical protein [Bacteriophage sp.]
MKYVTYENLTKYNNYLKDFISNKVNNLQEMLAYGV